MIYKMTLKDSSDTMTFNLLETPIVDKDIEGAVDNVTLDGNQYTDYLYLKKQYIQKWAIMCPDEYDELRGFYTRQFEEGEVPLYRVYYGANVTKDYIYNGDYFQFNAKGLETGMYLSQLTGNAEQTTYSGINIFETSDSMWTGASAGRVTYSAINDDFTFNRPQGADYLIANGTLALKPSTTYSIMLDVSQNTMTDAFRLITTSSCIQSSTLSVTAGATGKFYGKLVTRASLTQTYDMWLYCSSTGTLKTKIILVEGDYTSATFPAYEPYVGGTASPNPDYPQPISTVTGEQNIKVVGKNLYNNDLPLDNKYLDASGNWVTSTYSYINQEFNIQPSTTYTWSVTSKTGAPNLRFGEFDASGTFIQRTLITANTQTITTTATTALVKLSADETDQNKFNECQLELGSTATAYEPYQGQSYEVNLGKNLLNTEGAVPVSTANLTLTRGEDGSISWSGTAGNTFAFISSAIPVSLEPNDYVFSIGNVVDARTTLRFTHTDNTTTDLIVDVGSTERSGTLTKPTKNVRILLTNLTNGTSYSATIYPQLERGSRATSYAPYFTPIELAKIGTYQDRIYKDEGKWYVEKQVGKLNMADIRWDGLNGVGNPYRIGFVTDYGAENTTIISNIFTYSATAWAGNGKFGIASSGSLWMMTGDSTVDASNAPSWLANKNAIMYYALATPTTTEITDDTLLAQLNFIASLYEGVNNISITGTGAQGEMEVLIRDVLDVERDVVPETPVRLTLTDGGVINACGCRRDVQLTMRETTE